MRGGSGVGGGGGETNVVFQSNFRKRKMVKFMEYSLAPLTEKLQA